MDKKGRKLRQIKKPEKIKPRDKRKSTLKLLKTEDDIDLLPPLAPICTAVNFNSITLEWGQNDPAEDKLYTIEWSNQNKPWATLYNGYAKSEELKSLQPDTTYCFRLRYKKALAESEWSSILEVTTEKEPESMLDLHQAVQNEDYDKIISILENDENHQLKIDTPDPFGLSALMKALQMNSNKIAELLINHGANINYSDASGRNCLMTACFVGNLEAVKFLRKLGCVWTAKDNFGNTPLHCAIEGNSVEVVRWAIKDGADVNIPDKNGWTPLIKHATVGGSVEITKLLISKGADIDAQDIYGNTALILATVRNNVLIARELIENNCDWTLHTDYNRTVKEIAEGLDRRAIIQLLSKFKDKLDSEMKKKMDKDVEILKVEIHKTNDDTKEEAFLPDKTQLYKIPRVRNSTQSLKDINTKTLDDGLKPQTSSKQPDLMTDEELNALLNPKLQKFKSRL